MKSFEELQRIASGLGMRLENMVPTGPYFEEYCFDGKLYGSLTPIRTILAGELEKRAESIQEQWTWALELTKTEYTYHKVPGTVADLRSLAASLLADNEAEKEPQYSPRYEHDQDLVDDWEKQTGLKWDHKRADTFLDLLGFPLGCNPYLHLKTMEKGHDSKPKEPTECEGKYSVLHKIALYVYDECPVCGERIAALEAKR